MESKLRELAEAMAEEEYKGAKPKDYINLAETKRQAARRFLRILSGAWPKVFPTVPGNVGKEGA